MKKITILTLLLCLQCATGFGVVISMVDAPRDDPEIVRDCNFLCNHRELQPLTENYNELLQVRFWPLKMKDIAAIFGAKLDQKPDDRVKPLFGPTMIAESGLGWGDAGDKRHVDFHAIGNIGYLEIHYGWTGESVATAVIYFRADDKFVPVQSTNDIPRREAWDRAKYETLKKWLDDHLPKLTDLGVVAVSLSHPSRVDLGAGMACIITTRDIHTAEVPFWLSMDIAKETSAPPDFKSLQNKSVSRPNEPVGFTIDGKFYQLIPKLVEETHDSK
jgi:hypothetical protein